MMILFGFKGAGKTYYGKLVADALDWEFLDTDDLLEALYEERHGEYMTCKTIFQNRGEPYFRLLEKEVISTLQKAPCTVVAVGGGTVLDPENRHLLMQLGMLVYLRTSRGVLEERMEKNPPGYALAAVYEERKAIYESIPAVTIDEGKDTLKRLKEIACGK